MAAWLNSFFASFDHFFLALYHQMALYGGFILTPLAKLFAFIGDDFTNILFWIGLLLVFFTKSKRKTGAAMAGCVWVANAFCFLLKHLVKRPRPFIASELYLTWHQFVNVASPTSTSFPSGHVTAATAAILAFLIYCPKKKPYYYVSFLYVIIMGFSRNYLMVHYPSDVLFGFLAGIVVALAGMGFVKLFYFLFRLVPNFFISKFFLEAEKYENS